MRLLQVVPDWGVELELVSALPLQVHVSPSHQLGPKLEALTP